METEDPAHPPDESRSAPPEPSESDEARTDPSGSDEPRTESPEADARPASPGLDERWAALDESRPEPPLPDWRRPGNLIGIGLLVAALVAALLVWSPWDRWFICSDNDEHVVDEESGLCYAHPPEWTEMSESELAAEAEESGWFEPDTSGLRSPEGHIAWVDVAPAEHYVLGSLESMSTDELEEMARILATLSQAMSEGDPDVESESLEIDGREAATATARMPHSLFDLQADPEWIMWVRATVVDVEDGTSVMITTAMVEADEADAEEGTIAILDDVHDSIAVK
jgi:hypothetical protein